MFPQIHITNQNDQSSLIFAIISGEALNNVKYYNYEIMKAVMAVIFQLNSLTDILKSNVVLSNMRIPQFLTSYNSNL